MYRFHDSRVRTDFFMQLQDLTTVLSGKADLKFEYSFGAVVDVANRKVTASRFWEKLDDETQEAGLKSDVFLRAIGTLRYSNVPAMRAFNQQLKNMGLPKFGSQLFALLEDIRLEEIVKRERPGTSDVFHVRKTYFQHFFTQQLRANVTRSRELDELFCMIYLLLFADEPDPDFSTANEQTRKNLDLIKPLLFSVYDATSTHDIQKMSEEIVFRLEAFYEEDAINEYFLFPAVELNEIEKSTLFDELTRTDELENDDVEDVNKEESEYDDETFSAWHRESKNENRKQNFLQFELEQGTKTSMLGGGVRDTEDADQALASIQGTSGKSKNQDYSKLEALEKQGSKEEKKGSGHVFGEENEDAVAIFKEAETPSPEEEERYEEYVADIERYKRRLSDTIKKTIEHKKTSPRQDLVVGRLSKKLLSVVLDDNPRIFYKKNHESNEFDAVFTLLVDCSASMIDKMEETKKGIVLFHEVLKQLQIPHAIVGFWEDANEVREGYQPNYFHMIHTHEDSLYEKNGAKILQLEPEEDNRDGFSIRVATKELLKRSEKHKFLLVFSDGEPAAAGYDQNGIVDTHLAVSEARKKGIDVIGMFLAKGEIGESEEFTMENIYGKEKVMVPSVAELPEHFTPLLKKLLLKTI